MFQERALIGLPPSGPNERVPLQLHPYRSLPGSPISFHRPARRRPRRRIERRDAGSFRPVSRSLSRSRGWPGCAVPGPRRGQSLPLSLTQGMRFYLTTPIYYINSTPHIGHAYTTIAGDILLRHHRQRGGDTVFRTGTDEHASKVARVAEEQGLEPKEFADRIVEHWKELPRRINASIDFFIRTTD